VTKKHKIELYNNLLTLSRDIFFYKDMGLSDTFETRIYLMFMHFSILMIVCKKKGTKFNQKLYDYLFFNIEYNLRELGFGDVSVNKKMKDFNKILYDILLKIEEEKKENNSIKINSELVLKYFSVLNEKNGGKLTIFKRYFTDFFHFCFELSLGNMVEDFIKFENKYGSS